jgi:hypothetical protein
LEAARKSLRAMFAAASGLRVQVVPFRGQPSEWLPRNQMRDFRDGEIHRDLRFAHLRLGKLEAAISEVSKKYKCSRATLFGVWKRYERSRTRT